MFQVDCYVLIKSQGTVHIYFEYHVILVLTSESVIMYKIAKTSKYALCIKVHLKM